MDAQTQTIPGFLERSARRLFGGIAVPHRGFLVRGAVGTFGLKIGLSALQFGTGVALARLLGAEGLGVYTYGISWAMLAGVPAGFGLQQLVIRETARHAATERWSPVAGVWRWSLWVTVAASFGVTLVGLVVLYLLRHEVSGVVAAGIAMALLSVPLLALVRLGQAILQGLRRIVVAQMPEMLLIPALLLAGVGVLSLRSGGRLGPIGVLGLYVAAVAVGLVVMIVNVYRLSGSAVWKAKPEVHGAAWIRAAFPLLLLSGLHIVNSRSDILILGGMAGTAAVGLYGVASRGAELVTFVFMPVGRALEPLLAGLHGSGDRQQLQRVVTVAARATLLLSLPIVLGFVVFGRWFLLLFGPEFVASYGPLVILSIAQLISVSCGSVSLVLVMTGHERSALWGIAAGAVSNLVLNPVFIALFGMSGAAIGTATSILVWNAVMVYSLARREGVDATAFGLLRWYRPR